jgi:uncharacterized protein (DUF488 family)
MPRPQKNPLFTIGHSNHPIGRFLDQLRAHEIGAVADVRSSPYSRFVPHFSREPLRQALEGEGIGYLYLGAELGGKPPRQNPPAARLAYRERVQQDDFRRGIADLLKAMQERRMALLCRERDPLDCHRLHLICRYIKPMVGPIRHIMPEGEIEEHARTEQRLLGGPGSYPCRCSRKAGRRARTCSSAPTTSAGRRRGARPGMRAIAYRSVT